MGVYKVLKNDKLKGIFIGFVKGNEVELFTYGRRLRLKINEVMAVEIN